MIYNTPLLLWIKKLSSLIYRTLFYVNIYGSNKLLKTVRFFGLPCISVPPPSVRLSHRNSLSENCHTITSNVTGRHQGPKPKLRVGVACAAHLCGTWRPLVSVITTHSIMLRCVFIVECRIARFLCALYLCIQSSRIILIPRLPLYQFHFSTTSIAELELAHGEKWRTHSLTQLISCPGNRSYCFGKENILKLTFAIYARFTVSAKKYLVLLCSLIVSVCVSRFTHHKAVFSWHFCR